MTSPPPLQSVLSQLDYPHVLRHRPWFSSRAMQGLSLLFKASEGRAADLLDEFARLDDGLASIEQQPEEGRPDKGEPFWENPFLPAIDGIALYGLLKRFNPRCYIEVGSGHSTRFAARAIADHRLRTRIISIDPHPRAEIDALCDEVLRTPLEDVDPGLFDEIAEDDLVFMDGSHRVLQNSDATVFFLEILPVLKEGTIYGVHDIFLPVDYPTEWLERCYSEQYLLAAYLFGGADGDELILPAAHVTVNPELAAHLDPLWKLPNLKGVRRQGTSLWMRRGGRFVRERSTGTRSR